MPTQFLLDFAAQYPDPDGAAALRVFGAYLSVFDVEPLTATATQLDAFAREDLPILPEGPRNAYGAAVRGLYEAAIGTVPRTGPSLRPSTCLAAGVDPILASPDRLDLEAFVSKAPDDADCALAMRLLGREFGELDTGPVSGDDKDVARVFLPLQTEWTTDDAYPWNTVRWIMTFYEARARRGRVTPLVAMLAGVDPLVVSEDADVLSEFVRAHDFHRDCVYTMRFLARWCAGRGISPVYATTTDIKAVCVVSGERLVASFSVRVNRWIERFYAHLGTT